MKRIKIGGKLDASAVALGCWRTASLTEREMTELLAAATDAGIDFYDTADIYGGGKSEELLGTAVKNLGCRDRVLIQTKCAIRHGRYDFSKEHILESVEKSLTRLGTDHIDLLLLHRPDTLMEPDEVAEAFTKLHGDGKVLNFGVSNHNPMQIELLSSALPFPIIANQMQFGIAHSQMIDVGINVNTTRDAACDRDGFTLEYSRLKHITLQAWSPLQYGFFEGTFLGNNGKYPALNEKLAEYGAKLGLTPAAVSIAWILRHPAKIQPIVGTTSARHICEMAAAADAELTREQWYELYISAGNKLP